MKFFKVLGTIAMAAYSGLLWFYARIYSTFMGMSTKWKAVVGIPLVIIAIVPFIILAIPVAYVFHPDIGVWSDGYRMGTINEWGADRVHWYDPITTYEGEMFLGHLSTGGTWISPVTHEEEQPWRFSSSAGVMDEYRPKTFGHEVWVHYHQPLWRLNKWNGETNYRVFDVEEVDLSLAPDKCGNVSSNGGIFDRRAIPITGHMVKVSDTGSTHLTASYEARIQKGDQGNTFQDMSISSTEIRDCAVKFLKSGAQITVFYDQTYTRSASNPTADTLLNIVGIEKVK
jgi:hypothetical protein